MRSLGKTDAMREIMEILAGGKRPQGSMMHSLNLTQGQTDEFLGALTRGGLISPEEGGFYGLTTKGRSILASWRELDRSLMGDQGRANRQKT